MARIFLAIVGLAYVGLAIWCSLLPERVSKAVGFTLARGAGQSEFLTVYGGLEMALGILFLWPLFKPEQISFPLLSCLIVHLCLVLFRSLGFVLYREIPSTTCYLAATEWAVFLGSAVLWWQGSRMPVS